MKDRTLTKEQLQRENASLRIKIQRLEIMDEVLREAESRYRNLVENSPDFIYYLDQKGRLVSINQSGMLGFTPEDEDSLLGQPFAHYIYPDDRDLVIQSFLEAVAQKRQITKGLTFRVLKKSGEIIWVELHSRMSFDEQGNYLEEVGILRDVTERKRMEERLFTLNRELEETNRDLKAAYQWVRDSRDVLRKRRYQEVIGFLVDRDGRIEWLAETALTFTGRSRDALIGSNLLDLLQEESRQELLNALRQAWIGTVYPLSTQLSLNGGINSPVEVSITRVSSLETRRLWVMMQHPELRNDGAENPFQFL